MAAPASLTLAPPSVLLGHFQHSIGHEDTRLSLNPHLPVPPVVPSSSREEYPGPFQLTAGTASFGISPGMSDRCPVPHGGEEHVRWRGGAGGVGVGFDFRRNALDHRASLGNTETPAIRTQPAKWIMDRGKGIRKRKVERGYPPAAGPSGSQTEKIVPSDSRVSTSTMPLCRARIS